MADSAAATTLRRHNSLVVPSKLSRPAEPLHRTKSLQVPQNRTTKTPPLNLELASLNLPLPSYTSLRDILPSPNAAVNSPTGSAVYEISFRNRLVQQAASAYLRPMSTSPSTSSSAPHFLRRLSSACHSFFCHQLVPVFAQFFRRILHAFRGHVSTS